LCCQVHAQLFETIFANMSSPLRQAIDELLLIPEGQQRTYFNQLKEYPPSAKISSLKTFSDRYQALIDTGINEFEEKIIDTTLLNYLYRLTKRYSAKDIKRFKDHKQYALMICFLLETRKVLLDRLVDMHDQYVMEICRQTKNNHDKKHKEFRQRQKQAIDILLHATGLLLDWPDDKPIFKNELWLRIDKKHLLASIDDLIRFKRLVERGYCNLLMLRYPSLRKYFAHFIQLPFAVTKGTGALLKAIELVRQLDSGNRKILPNDAPCRFITKELRRWLKDDAGNINRNVWEMGLALAMRDAIRSGDLYLPQSKDHVSFWDLTLNELTWDDTKKTAYSELNQPMPDEIQSILHSTFIDSTKTVEHRFGLDNFAEIVNGKLNSNVMTNWRFQINWPGCKKRSMRTCQLFVLSSCLWRWIK